MVAESISKAKTSARADALRRMSLNQTQNATKDQKDLDGQLLAFLSQQSGIWASYRPLMGEVSPEPATQKCHHIQWAYPRVNNQNLEFYQEPEFWVKGAFGIQEPDPSRCKLISIQELTGCLVPGLSFDRHGTRLGRGLGYFDRALSEFKGIKVGLIFATQMSTETLPCESYDVIMDYIITNQNIFKIDHHPNQVREGVSRND